MYQQNATLKTQAGSLQTQNAAFNTQVGSLKSQVTDLQTSSDALKAQVEVLQEANTEKDAKIAQLQPLAEKARHLPVRWRITPPGILGPPGNVLFIFNLERTPLRLQITLNALGRTHSQNHVINGGGFFRITQLAMGDHVTLSADGYDPTEITVR